MNRSTKILASLLAISTISLSAFAVNAAQDGAATAPKGVKKWEYYYSSETYVEKSKKDGTYQMQIGNITMPREQGLNHLGKQGWELVGYDGQTYRSYIFKRELVAE